MTQSMAAKIGSQASITDSLWLLLLGVVGLQVQINQVFSGQFWTVRHYHAGGWCSTVVEDAQVWGNQPSPSHILLGLEQNAPSNLPLCWCRLPVLTFKIIQAASVGLQSSCC